MRRWGLLGLALASVGGALLLRVWHRGAYVPGWDLVAATNGLYLLSTQSPLAAVRFLWHQNRTFFLPFVAYSAPYVFLPGLATLLVPWLYWAHVTSFATFIALCAGVAAATGAWSAEGFAVLLLAVGCSPAILSYAVQGYPWTSPFLPTMLALLVILRPRRLWVTVLVLLAITELSWHVYELGKSVGLVLLFAAVLVREVSWRHRVVWALAGVWQTLDTLVLNPTVNVVVFKQTPGVGPFPYLPVTPATVLAGLRAVLLAIATVPPNTARLALPVLVCAGVAALWWVPRRWRRFLAVSLAFQMLMVVWLATISAGWELRARRFGMVEWTAIVILMVAVPAMGRGARRAMLALLLLGNVWQWVDLSRYLGRTFGDGVGVTLPFVESPEAAGFVDFAQVRWADTLLARARAGETLLLIYGHDCQTESMTNPTGLLERLYLQLGHAAFVRQVYAFDDVACTYACLPVHPRAELPAFLAHPPPRTAAYYDRGCEENGGGAPFRQDWTAAGFPAPTGRFMRVELGR